MSNEPTTTRDFDLGDILSITDGALVSPRHIHGVYDILNWMTGDELFTHQLPRAGDACREPLLEQHPQLRAVKSDFSAINDRTKTTRDEAEAVVAAWLAEQKAIYGDTLPVTPLASWHHIEPVQELVEMTETPDRIIVVEVP